MDFDPAEAVPLEELRASGVDAYARLHAAASDPAVVDAWVRRAAPDEEGVRATAARLPPPADSMPLWVITALAVDALQALGVADADDDEHAGPLLAWLHRHRPQLDHLLLTRWSAEDQPWAAWQPVSDPGGWVDPDLFARSVAGVQAAVPCDWWAAAAFVLLRDWFVELLPLLHALRLAPDRLVLDARAWLEDPEAQTTIAPHPKQLLGEFTGRAASMTERYAAWLDPPPPALRTDSAWTALLVFSDELLPVPSALRSTLADWDGVLAALREASSVPPAAPGYRPSSAVSRDYWTTEDTLGHQLYADAIAEFICHPDTRPPLTIGIKAPWGAGKTSLMRMVRDRLDPGANGAAPVLVKAERPVTAVTHRDALRWTAPDAHAHPTGFVGTVRGPQRATVWFNPWAYQTAEHLWAGLAQAIIEGVTARMDPRQRQRFWFELNIQRIDRARVRHRIHRLLLERVLPAALPGALLLAIGLALLPLAPALAAVGVSLTGVLAAAAGAGVRAGGLLQANLAGTYDELVRPPDYAAAAGTLHLVQEDVRRVLGLVATDDHPLVVFVDDLDRCSADVVARVIEALNLFLAGQHPHCIFVLAVEPDVVAAHLEAGRAELLQVLAEHLPAGTHFGMGWRFLDKMVQLPLRLPAPEDAQLEDYIDSILGRAPPRPALDASSVRRRAERLRAELSSVENLRATAGAVQEADAAAESVADDAGAAGRPTLDEETIRAAEITLAERLRDDSQEVRDLVVSHAGLLTRNPREVKRFINLFRFYAFVQVRRQLRDLPAPTLAQVGKMAVLAIRWPYLLSVLGLAVPADRATTVLAALEQGAGAADTWRTAVAAAGLRPAMRQRIAADDDLRGLLATDPPLADAVGFL